MPLEGMGFNFTTFVMGRARSFSRDIVNEYLGNLVELPPYQKCVFQIIVARGKWDF